MKDKAAPSSQLTSSLLTGDDDQESLPCSHSENFTESEDPQRRLARHQRLVREAMESVHLLGKKGRDELLKFDLTFKGHCQLARKDHQPLPENIDYYKKKFTQLGEMFNSLCPPPHLNLPHERLTCRHLKQRIMEWIPAPPDTPESSGSPSPSTSSADEIVVRTTAEQVVKRRGAGGEDSGDSEDSEDDAGRRKRQRVQDVDHLSEKSGSQAEDNATEQLDLRTAMIAALAAARSTKSRADPAAEPQTAPRRSRTGNQPTICSTEALRLAQVGRKRLPDHALFSPPDE